ncbi:MutS-related protein [Natronocalculus amylovorans]|uniref:DNA-binding protein MutS2 n=1 Tax=Natronocalculus amylovorans TaxID=2917812 RepID=A0AAE3FUJ6_9EURY|nr:helix-hairpin-helix domain-containing protein [Natronocalculus amylovorans]MCL9815887.1 endonuclease MutS2 [Natronocalculus amylovorans]NUE01601.1 endonuclease MutS2 [Halorubraceae archaeon YAN]
MELESIPGIGSKTADALAAVDDPETIIETGDVLALSRVRGISEGRAALIARGAIRRRHDDPGGFLATDRAKSLYGDALSLLQERAVTRYGKKRLETFYPSGVQSRIDEAQAIVETAMEREPSDAVRDALQGVEPLADPTGLRIRDRCLATGDGERYAEAKRRYPEISVETAEDARSIDELARSYSTVIVLDEQFAGLDWSGDVTVEPAALDQPELVAPERLLAFFAVNRSRLEAAAAVHRITGMEPACDLETLADVLSRVHDDGTIVGDEELTRLNVAVDDLDAAVGTATTVADNHLRDAIKKQDVTIQGQDFLSLVEQGARVDSLLARELSDEYDAAIEKARYELVTALQLDEGEAEFVEQIFGGEPTFPVTYREDAVSRFRTELTAERDRRANKLKATLAAELATLQEPVEELVRAALEIDVEQAIATFARDYDCVLPTVTATGGFTIEAGRSPLLDVEFTNVEPVDYSVSGVTLLSGVNSGGKTSTLDLVGLVVIFAHMGMPVPAARAEIQRFSELHYYAKSQGTLDAGAFESTLRDFGSLVDGADGRLVLVDELESITEPGASAKIIAGILEALTETDTTAVFVSHLAGEIQDAAAVSIAVDGIRAKGLVDGELQVDRSPKKDHLARSTPELIVEKLAGEAKDSRFYESLLEKF